MLIVSFVCFGKNASQSEKCVFVFSLGFRSDDGRKGDQGRKVTVL